MTGRTNHYLAIQRYAQAVRDSLGLAESLDFTSWASKESTNKIERTKNLHAHFWLRGYADRQASRTTTPATEN